MNPTSTSGFSLRRTWTSDRTALRNGLKHRHQTCVHSWMNCWDDSAMDAAQKMTRPQEGFTHLDGRWTLLDLWEIRSYWWIPEDDRVGTTIGKTDSWFVLHWERFSLNSKIKDVSECTCFSNITHYITKTSRLDNTEIIYSKVKSKV